MDDKRIHWLLSERRIRKRERDKDKIKSIVVASITNSEVALGIGLNEKSSTLVFREIYESIRQLGDAFWWKEGFEPLDHDVSLEILKGVKIKNNVRLNFLDRFRKIRNDANYRGYKVTKEQAEEICDFWKSCGLEIAHLIKVLD